MPNPPGSHNGHGGLSISDGTYGDVATGASNCSHRRNENPTQDPLGNNNKNKKTLLLLEIR